MSTAVTELEPALGSSNVLPSGVITGHCGLTPTGMLLTTLRDDGSTWKSSFPLKLATKRSPFGPTTIPDGLPPTVIGVPGAPVAGLTGVTEPPPKFVTYAVCPSAVNAMELGCSPTGTVATSGDGDAVSGI